MHNKNLQCASCSHENIEQQGSLLQVVNLMPGNQKRHDMLFAKKKKNQPLTLFQGQMTTLFTSLFLLAINSKDVFGNWFEFSGIHFIFS